MRRGLIGSTGFVGGSLMRQAAFGDTYHSVNIEQIAGREYDVLVCAGAPGGKWLANEDPAKDDASIQRLIAGLRKVKARKVVLVSTVDVYPHPVGVNEDTNIDEDALQPYGRHRRTLERFVAGAFDHLTVRLPGLFGRGLRKNVVFDLLHGHQVERIDPDSVFQFYDVDTLWQQIERIRALGLTLVNLATEPVSVRAVAREAFGVSLPPRQGSTPVRYDMTSIYAERLGGRNGYLHDRVHVLGELRRFVQSEIARR